MTTKELASRMFDVALSLIEWAEGDVKSARHAWNAAFEDAERIDHSQSFGEPDELDRAKDELDRAIAETAERLARAEDARRKFRIV